jgi:hypothetical protein
MSDDAEQEKEKEEEEQGDQEPNSEVTHNRELLDQFRENQRQEIAQKLLDDLPQGEGSTLDADTVDGLHAREILHEIAKGKGSIAAPLTTSCTFELPLVGSLPSVGMGKIVLLLTDGHIYVGTQV